MPAQKKSTTTIRVKLTGSSIWDAQQAIEAAQNEFQVTEITFTFVVEAKDEFEAGRMLGRKEEEIGQIVDIMERV